MRKIVLFALLGLLSVSCSNDDPISMENEVVGAWELVNIHGLTVPTGTPKYIRFDGVSYYSSDTETNPTSNAKSYSIIFKEDENEPKNLYNIEDGFKRAYFINISGGKEYRLTFIQNDLDLSYVLEPYVLGVIGENGDTTTIGVAAKRQSLPYQRVQ